MVVENFPTLRRMVRNMLHELGFESIDYADEGLVAMQELRSGSYDFLIANHRMLNTDGLMLLKTIRATCELRKLPVLLLWIDAKKEDWEAVKQMGASAILSPPLTVGCMAERIRTLFFGAHV